MSSTEESPAQRAARLRRERREAKIKEGGAARLDKITSLSGRTPSKDREEASPSPSLPPTVIPSPSPEPRAAPRQPPQTYMQSPPAPSVEDVDMVREQQEALRALLRQPVPASQQDTEEDPNLKLLQALMGGMGGMPGGDQGPNAGAGAPSTGAGAGGIPPELASSLGLPPWMSSMLGAATQQESEDQKRTVLTWKILHTVFSIVLGIYLVLLTSSSVATFGKQPPPPATAQNPFLYFTTGELVMGGARILIKSQSGGLSGPFLYIQLLKDFIRDGSIVLFFFGMGAWWNQGY